MDKLVSMTDFVLEFSHSNAYDNSSSFEEIYNYAKFLKQNLNIGMFVPAKKVDGVWIVLEEPRGVKCCAGATNDCFCHGDLQFDEEALKEYQEAEVNCLFEGFSLDGNYLWYKGNLFIISDNIQDSFEGRKIEFLLSYYKEEITLTESAKKQIGL